MAGANSIFDGDKLLTTPNNERNADLAMFKELGLKSRPAFMPYASGAASSNGTEAAESPSFVDPTSPPQQQAAQQQMAA